MDRSRAVLVLTSCTGRKDPAAKSAEIAAQDLYKGEQHKRLMRGVRALREAPSDIEVDLRIVSAGYGVVRGSRRLRAYDASFSGLAGPAIDAAAESLSIRAPLRRLLSRDYALVLLLLGEDYMRAAGIGPETRFGGPTIAFGGRRLAQREASLALRVVPAGRDEARRYSCGVVGLKGEMAGRLLELVARRPELLGELADPDLEVLGLLDGAGAAEHLIPA